MSGEALLYDTQGVDIDLNELFRDEAYPQFSEPDFVEEIRPIMPDYNDQYLQERLDAFRDNFFGTEGYSGYGMPSSSAAPKVLGFGIREHDGEPVAVIEGGTGRYMQDMDALSAITRLSPDYDFHQDTMQELYQHICDGGDLQVIDGVNNFKPGIDLDDPANADVPRRTLEPGQHPDCNIF